MDTPRIRMGHAYGETPSNVYSDFDWVRRNEQALLDKYGECSIIVFQEQVIGVGKTYDEALEDAERNLPPEVAEVTPIHERLRRRKPFTFLYVHPQPATVEQAGIARQMFTVTEAFVQMFLEDPYGARTSVFEVRVGFADTDKVLIGCDGILDRAILHIDMRDTRSGWIEID